MYRVFLSMVVIGLFGLAEQLVIRLANLELIESLEVCMATAGAIGFCITHIWD